MQIPYYKHMNAKMYRYKSTIPDIAVAPCVTVGDCGNAPDGASMVLFFILFLFGNLQMHYYH